jgi:hypothetical protein
MGKDMNAFFVWIISSASRVIAVVADEDMMHEYLDDMAGIYDVCCLPEGQWKELYASPNWMGSEPFQKPLELCQ